MLLFLAFPGEKERNTGYLQLEIFHGNIGATINYH